MIDGILGVMERFSDEGVRNGIYVEHRLEWDSPGPPLPEECPDIRIAVPDDADEEVLIEFVDEEEGTWTNCRVRSIVEWVKRNRPDLIALP